MGLGVSVWFYLVAYWALFFARILANPYSIASSEALDCDFPVSRFWGESWRKGRIPLRDPYYYGDIAGARPGTFYPGNIIFSFIGSFLSLDKAWRLHTLNLILHNLGTALFAYAMFGGGPIGVFGGLAYGFAGYHIKQSTYRTQGFCWVAATLCFLEKQMFPAAGVSLGLLYLSGPPPLFLPFTFLLGGYLGIRHTFPSDFFAAAFLVGFPQLYAYGAYFRRSVRKTAITAKIGGVPLVSYLMMFIPIRYRLWWGGVGFKNTAFYVGPIAGFFASFGRGHCWWLVMFCIVMSLGIPIINKFSKVFTRFPYRWGYFAMLGVVFLSVDGLRRFGFSPLQFAVINTLLAVSLLFNRGWLPIYPDAQWTKRPSELFNTPLLKWLEVYAEGYRVNNLPYPAYTGHINHIRSMGYCGGNRTQEIDRLRRLPPDGCGGQNWFDTRGDGKDLDRFGVRFHIGDRPAPRWKECYPGVWENEKAG